VGVQVKGNKGKYVTVKCDLRRLTRRRIKGIAAHRKIKAKNKRAAVEYRVQWVGYDSSHDQWIRHSNLHR
jgi:hypothetical protein